MSESLKPMGGYLKKFAELYEQGKSVEEIAQELGISPQSIRRRYLYEYDKYVEYASEKISELLDGGVSPEEAARKVKEELGITDRMVEEALKKALEQAEQKQGGAKIDELRKEGTAAAERIKQKLQESTGAEEGENVKKDLVDEFDRMINTIDAIARRLNVLRGPVKPSNPSPGSAVPADVVEQLQELAKGLEAIKQSLQPKTYVGRLKRVRRPDGSEEEYEVLPEDQVRLMMAEIQKKQAETVMDKYVPKVLERLDKIDANVSSIANRLLTLFESTIAPTLKQRAPEIVRDFEDRFRRLVGSMSQEEKLRTLVEMEKKVEEASKK